MNNTAIAAVADVDRLKQTGRLLLREMRKKAREPRHELTTLQRGGHALRFDQCGREKILTARLPALAIRVLRVPAQGRRPEQRSKAVVLRGRRIFKCKPQREGGIAV